MTNFIFISFMQLSACFLALWSIFTWKWMFLIAAFIEPLLNERFVSGWTHFSAIMLAISLKRVSCWNCCSSLLIYISPLSSISFTIALCFNPGNHFFSSFFFTSFPWVTFVNILCTYKTSSISCSLLKVIDNNYIWKRTFLCDSWSICFYSKLAQTYWNLAS